MTPWMKQHEIDLILSYIKSKENVSMLEYGSGGSTPFFAGRVKSLVSVEHDLSWFTKVSDHLLEKDVNNVSYYLKSADNNYASYLDTIDEVSKHYDIVLIDGRQRVETARRVIPYLNKDAVVFIHDYYVRPQFSAVMKWYKELAGIFDTPSIVALSAR